MKITIQSKTGLSNIFYKIHPYQYAECYYGYQTTYKNKINVSMQDIKYNLSR